MKYSYIKNSTILIISLVVGFIATLQYVSQKSPFTENNSWRETRILMESNYEMQNKINALQDDLDNFQTEEQLILNAKSKIAEAKNYAGIEINQQDFLTILVEGEVKVNHLIEIVNDLWNAGVDNIQINGNTLSYDTTGFDESGGQILMGGIPVSSPYMFKVFGNTNNLLHILDPKTGTLKKFNNDKLKVVLSPK